MQNSKKFKKVKERSKSKNSGTPVVLHVSTPSSWRGGEQQLFYLLEELEKQGLQQHLICNSQGELFKRAKAKSWNVVGCKKRSGVDLNFAFQIKHLCKSLGITVIHTHDSQSHTMAFLATTILKNTTPIVVSRRVDFSIGKSFMSRFKYNHPQVKKILCVSDAIKAIMKPDIKDHKKLLTVHSGINLSRFENISDSDYLRKKFNVAEEEKLIGNVSAIAPHKDYYTFVNTVEILVQQNIKAKFFIVGDGPERKNIEKYVADKKLGEHIYFTGFITDVLPVLKSLDLMLITSETEGLGTIILDAFACEVPVIGTRAGGIPEIVQHEKTGLTAEVKDATTLAQLTNTLFEQEENKNTYVQNALTLLKDFSRENTAKKTLQVYKKLL